jgi:hypothetical protein
VGLFNRWKKDAKPAPSGTQRTSSTPAEWDLRVEVGFEREEVIPIKQRIAHLRPDGFGLFPHEILLLDYAPKFITSGQKFQGFWEYSYGVTNVRSNVKSLVARGFLATGSVSDTVRQQTAAALKPVLAANGLSVAGAKGVLVSRILADVPAADLELAFPARYYTLTDTGSAALEASPFIPYIHKHPTTEQLDIFTMSQMVASDPALPWRDHLWRFLNERGVQRASEGNWGLYRNVRHSMAEFVAEEERWLDAIALNAEICFWDTSGMSNGFRFDYLPIHAPYFFPYQETSYRPAPTIVEQIFKWGARALLDEQALRHLVSKSLTNLSAPFHLFSKQEVAEIVFRTRAADVEALTALYERAKHRFQAAHPEIDLARR